MINEYIYDYAIIGAGITGMVTSLLLKKENPESNIVILEKNKFTGGFAASSKLAGIGIDPIYLFPDIRKYLKRLEINLPLYQYKKAFYIIKLIDDSSFFEIDLPPDKNGFLKVLIDNFPEEKNNIINFMDFCIKIENQFLNLKSKFSFSGIFKFLFTSFNLIVNMNMTVSGLIKKFKFKNKKLIRILESFAGLAQLPPVKLNALIPIIAIVNLLKSSFRSEYLFDDLISKFEDKMTYKKIDLKLKKEVINIATENGIFKISTRDNDVVFAKKIISTIDTKKIFLEVISRDLLPDKFVKKINDLEMTLSAFIIKMIVKSEKKYETDIGQVLFYGGSDTFHYLYNKSILGDDILNHDIFHFALSIKPIENHNNIYSFELLSVPVSFRYWKKIFNTNIESYKSEIKRWEDFFLDKLEKHFDVDIKGKILKKQSFTPINFAKILNLSDSSFYDMAQINSQAGMKRQGFKTPVNNFYHCKMVHGIYGSILQAFLLCDYLLSGKINDYKYRWDD